jgi:hypothetical protein
MRQPSTTTLQTVLAALPNERLTALVAELANGGASVPATTNTSIEAAKRKAPPPMLTSDGAKVGNPNNRALPGQGAV